MAGEFGKGLSGEAGKHFYDHLLRGRLARVYQQLYGPPFYAVGWLVIVAVFIWLTRGRDAVLTLWPW